MKKLIDNDVLTTKSETYADPDDASWSYVNNTVEIAPKVVETDNLAWHCMTLSAKESNLSEYSDSIASFCIELPVENLDEIPNTILLKSSKDNSGQFLQLQADTITLYSWNNDWEQHDHHTWTADYGQVSKSGKTSESSKYIDIDFSDTNSDAYNWRYLNALNVQLKLSNAAGSTNYVGSGIIYYSLRGNTGSIGVIRMPYSNTEAGDVNLRTSIIETGKKIQIDFSLANLTLDSSITKYEIIVKPVR